MDEIVETAAKTRWDYERAESGDTTEWEMRYPAFREFDTDAMRAALESVAHLIAAQALMDAVELMRRCKDPGHWNLRDPHDPETSYSPDVWLGVYADRIERGES